MSSLRSLQVKTMFSNLHGYFSITVTFFIPYKNLFKNWFLFKILFQSSQFFSLLCLSRPNSFCPSSASTECSIVTLYLIWLESTRKYSPISRMSPNHVQIGCSPGLIFSKKCTNLFAFFQWKVAYQEYVKTFSRRCHKKIVIFG